MDDGQISVEVDGKIYMGGYSLSGQGPYQLVTVRRPLGGSITTQVGGSPPDSIARMLLRELVEAEKGRKVSMA